MAGETRRGHATTPEEAYEYGKLVATQDPDGNGKNDTFLYSPYGLWADCWMIFPFLPFSLQHAASYLPDRDGEYKIKEKWTVHALSGFHAQNVC